MPDLTPEQRARQQIDAQLVACGWAVQNFREVDFSAGRGVALREVALKSGPCDYLLLVDRIPEYFDAFMVGLTATPAPQTIAYFHQNRVAEYNHERAVADGVNVGYDVYRIKTRVTEQGGKVEKGFLIDHRSKASRAVRQQVLADDLDFTPQDLDRSVVVPDQIRTVLRTYRDAVSTELFPNRVLLPKTLIFAKDDSHAEDIVHICREVFLDELNEALAA